MKTRIYTVRDNKTQAFGQIYTKETDGAMIREFSDAVNNQDKSNPLWNHSDDFELYQLGEYDNSTGTIEPSAPKSIITATQLKK